MNLESSQRCSSSTPAIPRDRPVAFLKTILARLPKDLGASTNPVVEDAVPVAWQRPWSRRLHNTYVFPIRATNHQDVIKGRYLRKEPVSFLTAALR